MTISVPGQLVYSSQGDGVTTEFTYPVRFEAASELVVISREDGVDTVLTLDTDYTVAGAGVAGGGTVTMLYTPTAAEEIVRYRDTAAKQIVNLADSTRNPAEAVENQLDRFAMKAQDQSERLSRAVLARPGSTGQTLPEPEADKIIMWNSDGEGLINRTVGEQNDLVPGVNAGDLISTNNGSDFADISAVRTNLGLGTAAVEDASVFFDKATYDPNAIAGDAFLIDNMKAADGVSFLSARNRWNGYTPLYNLDGDMTEGAGTNLSVQHIFDMGDITLPNGSGKQHAVFSFGGIVRSDDPAEQEGFKVLRFDVNSYNADLYLIQGVGTLKTGVKAVKAGYFRASVESTDTYISGDFGGVGVEAAVSIGSGSTAQTAWVAQLQLDGAGDAASSRFINMASDQPSKVAHYGIFSDPAVSYQEAFIRAWNTSGGGAFVKFQKTVAEVHTDIFVIDAVGRVYRDGLQILTSRRQGWAAATGTATRTTFATGSVTTAQLAERVKALIDDLTIHGLIGA